MSWSSVCDAQHKKDHSGCPQLCRQGYTVPSSLIPYDDDRSAFHAPGFGTVERRTGLSRSLTLGAQDAGQFTWRPRSPARMRDENNQIVAIFRRASGQPSRSRTT